jgi:hypothetical protein
MGKYRDAWLLIQKQLQPTRQNRELFELIDECVLTYEDIYTAEGIELSDALDKINITFQELERTLAEEDDGE